MYYWLALMLFFGGLVPLLAARKWVRSKYGVLVLGWLAWVCGISLKGFLNMVLSLVFPALFLEIVPYTITAVLVESTEVLAAFLFLRYHPAFKRLTLHDVVGFAVGFGVGEALTGAAFSVVFVDIPFYGLVSLAAMVERWSAVAIHLASNVFIGLYVTERRVRDIAAGLLIKSVSATSVSLPTVMELWFSGNWVIYMTELVIMLYAAVALSLAWLCVRGVKFGKARAKPEMRRKQLVVSGAVFSLVAISYYFLAPYIAHDNVSATFLAVAYSMVAAVVFKMVFNISRTETLIGAFAGFAVYDIFSYNLLAIEFPVLMQNVIGFALVSSSALRLFGVICGVYLLSVLKRKKLNVFI